MTVDGVLSRADNKSAWGISEALLSSRATGDESVTTTWVVSGESDMIIVMKRQAKEGIC
jgi:hypothetical protein